MTLFGWLGRLNPLRLFGGYFERHPWQRRLLILAPFLLLLALLNPGLGAVDKLVALVGRVFTPLLETGVGRAVLLVLVLLLLAAVLYAVAKERILGMFRRYVLSVHLAATEAFLIGDHERAKRGLRRVVRIGRWLDLAKGPAAGYGSLAADAQLKLARVHLQAGSIAKARAWLARIPRPQLSKRLALSYAELNARVFAAHPDHIPESVLQVLEESHAAWPGHLGISELLADRLLDRGQGERAAEVLGETLRRASPARAPEVAAKLARLQLRLARETLLAGKPKDASRLVERSLRLEESEEGLLLKADVHLARGELDAALGVLGGLASPAAKARCADLLRREEIPLDPRRLLGAVPRQDTIVAVAEFYLERGEHRRASRALELILRHGTQSPRVLALLACVKLEQQAPEEANRNLRRALATLESRSRRSGPESG